MVRVHLDGQSMGYRPGLSGISLRLDSDQERELMDTVQLDQHSCSLSNRLLGVIVACVSGYWNTVFICTERNKGHIL